MFMQSPNINLENAYAVFGDVWVFLGCLSFSKHPEAP